MDDVMPLSEKYYLQLTADVIKKYAKHWSRGTKKLVFKYQAFLIRRKFWNIYRTDAANVIRDNLIRHYDTLHRDTSGEGVRVIMVVDKCPDRYAPICESVKEAAGKFKWDLLDPDDEIDFSDPEMVIRTDGHPSSEANRALSRFIYGYMKKNP